MHRRREHRGRLRKDAQRFLYEPILIGGRVVMPAELQRMTRQTARQFPAKCVP